MSYSVAAEREARDMAADVRVLVRAQHHRHRIPAHVRPDAMLDVLVAGNADLLVHRDRVDVRRCSPRRAGTRPNGAPLSISVLDQEVRAVGSLGGEDARERVEPFARFLGIGIAFHHVHEDSPTTLRLTPNIVMLCAAGGDDCQCHRREALAIQGVRKG